MSQRTDLSVSVGNRQVPVTITDTINAILKSPDVTQAFLRAVATVITRYVGGVVASVVIEIGAIQKSIEIEQHRQKVTIRISKLEVVTEECARAVVRAEASNYPPEMKQELIDRLYGLFYEEMANISPRRM